MTVLLYGPSGKECQAHTWSQTKDRFTAAAASEGACAPENAEETSQRDSEGLIGGSGLVLGSSKEGLKKQGPVLGGMLSGGRVIWMIGYVGSYLGIRRIEELSLLKKQKLLI